MSRFRPIERETDYLPPPSVQDWHANASRPGVLSCAPAEKIEAHLKAALAGSRYAGVLQEIQ